MAAEMHNTIHTLNPTETLTTINTTREELELQQLLDILLEDLYTESLVEYEPSIIFQAIKESCSEITFLSVMPKTFIFYFHMNVRKTSFVLRNPTPQTMHLEKKAATVIIPRAHQLPSVEDNNNVMTNQQLSKHWEASLSLNDLNSPPPMIFILWNCRGIKY